jgi:hypothetical protein
MRMQGRGITLATLDSGPIELQKLIDWTPGSDLCNSRRAQLLRPYVRWRKVAVNRMLKKQLKIQPDLVYSDNQDRVVF